MHIILGIKSKSILFELSSINFPRSFPVDIMHLFFENITPQMFKLWSAHFFKDDNLNITPFNISKSSWDLIGSLMQNNKKICLWNLADHHEIYLNIMLDIKQKNGQIG